MQTRYLTLVIVYAFAALVLSPAHSFAQSAYGMDETASDDHRVLTIPRRRATTGMVSDGGCGVAYYCRPRPMAVYEPDATDPTDPFDTCVSGCDVDVIFRALTGRPNRGW